MYQPILATIIKLTSGETRQFFTDMGYQFNICAGSLSPSCTKLTLDSPESVELSEGSCVHVESAVVTRADSAKLVALLSRNDPSITYCYVRWGNSTELVADECLIEIWANLFEQLDYLQHLCIEFHAGMSVQSALRLAHGLSLNRSLRTIELQHLPREAGPQMREILHANPIFTFCNLAKTHTLTYHVRRIIGK
jgi:hypothetical protein